MDLQIQFDYNDFFGLPEIDIQIDSTSLYRGTVQEYFTFTHDVPEGPHTLSIYHINKVNSQVNAENDRHVFIKKIWLDSIDIDQVDYCQLSHRGRFYPEYDPEYVKTCALNQIDLPEYISPNHYLGHNGCWRLDFNSPALLWIIRQQNPTGMDLDETIFSTGHAELDNVKNFFDF